MLEEQGMTRRALSGHVAAGMAVAIVSVSIAAGIAMAQTPSSSGSGPRTPWGDPDLQGTWTTDDTIGVPVERPQALGDKLFLTDEDLAQRAKQQEEARRKAAEAAANANRTGPAPIGPPDHWGENASQPVRQTSFVVHPANGRIPAVTPEAQKRAAGRDRGSFGTGPFNGPEDLTNFDRCGVVAISYEMIHEPRIIPIGNAAHIGSAIRQYMGDARGHWEGETLVVVTTNFTDKMSIGFNGNGLRHSDAMRLVERFTRVDAKTIQWEVTIEDPKTYTQPFKMALPIRLQSDYVVYEYACHEGNYGMRNILSAARADEGGTR
jgi:hypothetical protein